MKVQAVFDEIKQTISNEIDNASSSILIALAYFNDKDLFELLCKKATDGVKVEIIVSSEDDSYLNGTLDYQRLVNSGGICLFTDNIDNGLMHHKFCLIDENTIITGSYNWTNKAATSNYENIIVVKDANDLFYNYIHEFEKLKTISNSKLTFANSFKNIRDFNSTLIEEINNRSDGFGYEAIDKILHGFQKPGLYSICARPSIGSTTMILNVINNFSQKDKSILLFSLDLSSIVVVKRLISNVSGIPFDKIISGNLDKHDWLSFENAQKELSDREIFIDDTADLTIKDIELSILKQLGKQSLDLIVIDYLELMKVERKAENSNKFQRDYELDWIVRELKRISKVTNIPILVVSQLNRQNDNRENKLYKTPQINEIQNYIEQYSDVVTILNRPEFYHITEDALGYSLLNVLEITIAKNKFGDTGDVKLYLDKRTLKISNEDPNKDDFPEGYQTISSKMFYNANNESPLSTKSEPRKSDEVPF